MKAVAGAVIMGFDFGDAIHMEIKMFNPLLILPLAGFVYLHAQLLDREFGRLALAAANLIPTGIVIFYQVLQLTSEYCPRLLFPSILFCSQRGSRRPTPSEYEVTVNCSRALFSQFLYVLPHCLHGEATSSMM